MELAEYLGGPRLGDVGLSGEGRSAQLLVLALCETDEGANDRQTPGPLREAPTLHRRRCPRPPLAQCETGGANVEVSLSIRPGPTGSGQDGSERLGNEWRDEEGMSFDGESPITAARPASSLGYGRPPLLLDGEPGRGVAGRQLKRCIAPNVAQPRRQRNQLSRHA